MLKKLFNFGKKKEENQVEEVAQSVEEVENIETEEKVVEAVDFKLSSTEELDIQYEVKSEENENVTETEVEENTDEIVEEENNEDMEVSVEEIIETIEEDEDTTEKEEVIESNLDTTEEVIEEKVSLFNRLKSGLTKAKQGITDKIDAVLNSYTTIDEDLLEELEEILITADVGVNTTMEMIDNLRDAIKSKGLTNPLEVRDELKTLIENMLGEEDSKLNIEPGPSIILMVGVNGVGKTTTIGKLANRYTKEGKKVLLAAGDTFRAAAIEQLEVWAIEVMLI